MKQLHFEGYSDDTFACSGKGIDVNHDNCASCEPIDMVVTSAEGSMLVRGQYSVGGGWLIGIAPPDETDEIHIPEWPMRFTRSDREYSPRLVIDAPDDVSVKVLGLDDEDED